MSENENFICPDCFLLQSDMPKHRFIEHGVKLSEEEEAKILAKAKADAAKTAQDSKIDMEYMGKDGPTQPK